MGFQIADVETLHHVLNKVEHIIQSLLLINASSHVNCKHQIDRFIALGYNILDKDFFLIIRIKQRLATLRFVKKHLFKKI